jgi:hypothetical protein
MVNDAVPALVLLENEVVKSVPSVRVFPFKVTVGETVIGLPPL